MGKVMVNGTQFDRDAVVNLMDSEQREKLSDIAFCTDQDFVDAYCRVHEANFGEKFIVN